MNRYDGGNRKEKNINFFGYKIFTVMSNSMQPVFQEGDLIIDKELFMINTKSTIFLAIVSIILKYDKI